MDNKKLNNDIIVNNKFEHIYTLTKWQTHFQGYTLEINI